MKRLEWLSVEDYGTTPKEIAIRELEQRGDDLSDVGVMALRNVVGKEVVESMSPEFVGFIQDAYRSLKYERK